jgi:hypothetical protein
LRRLTDEGVIASVGRDRRPQCGFVAFALGRDHDKTLGLVQLSERIAVDSMSASGVSVRSPAGAAIVTW